MRHNKGGRTRPVRRQTGGVGRATKLRGRRSKRPLIAEPWLCEDQQWFYRCQSKGAYWPSSSQSNGWLCGGYVPFSANCGGNWLSSSACGFDSYGSWSGDATCNTPLNGTWSDVGVCGAFGGTFDWQTVYDPDSGTFQGYCGCWVNGCPPGAHCNVSAGSCTGAAVNDYLMRINPQSQQPQQFSTGGRYTQRAERKSRGKQQLRPSRGRAEYWCEDEWYWRKCTAQSSASDPQNHCEVYNGQWFDEYAACGFESWEVYSSPGSPDINACGAWGPLRWVQPPQGEGYCACQARGCPPGSLCKDGECSDPAILQPGGKVNNRVRRQTDGGKFGSRYSRPPPSPPVEADPIYYWMRCFFSPKQAGGYAGGAGECVNASTGESYYGHIVESGGIFFSSTTGTLQADSFQVVLASEYK